MRTRHAFLADVGHLTITGLCADCSARLAGGAGAAS